MGKEMEEAGYTGTATKMMNHKKGCLVRCGAWNQIILFLSATNLLLLYAILRLSTTNQFYYHFNLYLWR